MIRILIDLRRNTLQLVLTEEPVVQPRRETVAAVLDIGEAGALLGIELRLDHGLVLAVPESDPADAGDTRRNRIAYLGLAESSTPLARSTHLNVNVLADETGLIGRITIPRRGDGYEISFPSGNRCWRPRQTASGPGQPVAWCSEVM